MSSERVEVALLHDGRVLVDEAGALPVVEPGEDYDARFETVLDAVGADVYLGPTLSLGEDHTLDLVGCRAAPTPGGRWVEPAEVADEAVRHVLLTAVAELASPPPLRPAWFRSGWYDDVEAWVDEVLAASGRRRTGALRPVKMWSISGVVRVPTDAGAAWFKASAEVFRAEAGIHEVLARHFPDDVPVLLGADPARAWVLMEPLSGQSEATRAPGAAQAVAARWPALQRESLAVLDDLRRAGCPVRDAEATVAGLGRVLDGSPRFAAMPAEQRDPVLAVREEAEAMVRELWACGLPDTLCHGDLHLGNVAWDGSALRFFDLTDACLSHPLLDGTHLAAFDDRDPADGDLFATFVDAWREACPDADLDRAARLAPLVDLVFQVDTFERIAAGTEPASAHELSGAVGWLLRRLPDAVAAAR